jgi:hypothetical protein
MAALITPTRRELEDAKENETSGDDEIAAQYDDPDQGCKRKARPILYGSIEPFPPESVGSQTFA